MKAILILFLGLLAACTQEQQEAPETPATTQTSGLKKTLPEGISWQAPAGWTEEAPSSAMRKAQYALPKADGDPEDASVVIFYFQGQGGSVEANIERWYSQLAQPDGTPTRDKATRREQLVNGLKQTIVDVTGTYLSSSRPMGGDVTEKPGFRMLAAVVEAGSGLWFVKFVGPENTVKKWESSFGNFLRSFSE